MRPSRLRSTVRITKLICLIGRFLILMACLVPKCSFRSFFTVRTEVSERKYHLQTFFLPAAVQYYFLMIFIILPLKSLSQILHFHGPELCTMQCSLRSFSDIKVSLQLLHGNGLSVVPWCLF